MKPRNYKITVTNHLHILPPPNRPMTYGEALNWVNAQHPKGWVYNIERIEKKRFILKKKISELKNATI